MADLVVTTRVRLVATFRDEDGQLANPTTVVWSVRKPDGTLVDPAPTGTNPSTGIYHLVLTLDAPGRWKVEVQGAGAVIVAGDFVVNARLSVVDRG